MEVAWIRTKSPKWEDDYIRFLTNKNISGPGDTAAGREIIVLDAESGDENEVNDSARVLILLSDERCERKIDLEKEVLFMRQYNSGQGTQIPLGYVTGFEQVVSAGGTPLHPSKREYNWAFIGDISKSDRAHMIECMSSIPKGYKQIKKTDWNDMNSLNISPRMLSKIYQHSVFVPVGRGYTSLDCYRIYEAIETGAIPIVVGPVAEAAKTFAFNGSPPPLLVFESWDEAVRECLKLLESRGRLQSIQYSLIGWWIDINDSLKRKIRNALL